MHKQLIEKAIGMMNFSYAPYSGFTVGAAILCADGSVFGGCNVEGSSFGTTICAERVALVKAVSEGKRDFVALAVCAPIEDYCSPCGICRQLLADFAPNLIVYCCNKHGDFIKKSISELLPMAFTGDSLK